MIIALLFAIPFSAALTAIILPNRMTNARRWLPPVAGLLHLALVVQLWRGGVETPEWMRDWIHPDGLGRLFLTLTSGLFLPASWYAVGDMRRYAAKGHGEGVSERVFAAGLLFFLFTMTGVCLAQDMGMLWVAVEATTLATAPLIYFRKSTGALEATWKYLLVCSVGIVMALLGTFFLASAAGSVSSTVTLNIRVLADAASGMDASMLKAAFIFLLVGYGAKMGLAPMHTWLPDAHSESPSPVSALLSGTLLNGAFLAILRCCDIMQSAGLDAMANQLLRIFGLASMVLAGAFILGQRDFKRLLAYSSVEHMGILAFGLGMGGLGLWPALLHAVNHTFVKGCLFLTAGNIMFHYHSKSTTAVTGLRREMPVNSALWLAGFLAICGLPPFGLFASEFAIVATAFGQGRYTEAALFLFALALVFVGMMSVLISMCGGTKETAGNGEERESFRMALPALAALSISLALGFGVPGFLSECLIEAAAIVDTTFSAMPGILP